MARGLELGTADVVMSVYAFRGRGLGRRFQGGWDVNVLK